MYFFCSVVKPSGGSSGGNVSSSSAGEKGAPQLGGLFAGGMPKLKPSGQAKGESSTHYNKKIKFYTWKCFYKMYTKF